MPAGSLQDTKSEVCLRSYLKITNRSRRGLPKVRQLNELAG